VLSIDACLNYLPEFGPRWGGWLTQWAIDRDDVDVIDASDVINAVRLTTGGPNTFGGGGTSICLLF
jgi:hypothetical protein